MLPLLTIAGDNKEQQIFEIIQHLFQDLFCYICANIGYFDDAINICNNYLLQKEDDEHVLNALAFIL